MFQISIENTFEEIKSLKYADKIQADKMTNCSKTAENIKFCF